MSRIENEDGGDDTMPVKERFAPERARTAGDVAPEGDLTVSNIIIVREWEPQLDSNGQPNGLTYQDSQGKTVYVTLQPDGSLVISVDGGRFVARQIDDAPWSSLLGTKGRPPIFFYWDLDPPSMSVPVDVLSTGTGIALQQVLGVSAADAEPTVADLGAAAAAFASESRGSQT